MRPFGPPAFFALLAFSPAVSAQTPGASHAAGYYDSVLRRVVLVGGAGAAEAGVRDKVWSWSGRRWEPVTDSGPASRMTGGAAYDVRQRTAVVTGGARQVGPSSFETVADTWLGGPAGWKPITGNELDPRDHQSLVYDANRQTVLMFGGIPAERSAPWPSDTWELRAGGWTRIATGGPPARARTALVYDPVRRQTVLFGGVGEPVGERQEQRFYNDTWVFDRSGWRRVATDGPPGRYAHGMVFDERAGVVLLYSGAAAHRGAPLTDMWQWDGARWSEVRLTGPTPGYRYQPVMVYDRARGKTVLYGGSQDSTDATWEWDGRSWTVQNRVDR